MNSGFRSEGKMPPNLAVSNGTVRFSPDGATLVSWHMNKLAHVWETSTGRTLYPPLSHDDRVYDVQFSRDGRWIATTSLDGFARVWEAATGKLLATLEHPTAVTSGRFSRDGRFIVTTCDSGLVRLWDWQKAQDEAPPLETKFGGHEASFSPDERWILTTSRLLDRQTLLPLAPALTQDGPWWNVVVTPTSDRAVIAGWSGGLYGFSLRDLLRPEEASPEELVLLGEVAAFRTIRASSSVGKLTADEWLKRWRHFRATYPRHTNWPE
jgi:WD40 repeat protein